MTVLPVIVRELRASARQPFTYSLRVLGVALLLLASVLFGLHFGFHTGLGRLLFTALHCTLFGATWVLVPMLTADCISRERREGTLGLLFMTPLKGSDIVVAKGLVHGLRAMTLWLAVLPVLMIPFLVGGVSWKEATLSVVVNANAMCWALAAGLLASAWSRTWLRALLGAMMLAFAFFLALTTGVGWFLLRAFSVKGPRQLEPNWDTMFAVGLEFATNIQDFWSNYTGSEGGGFNYIAGALGSRVFNVVSFNQVAWVLGQITLCSLLVLLFAILTAGAKTRRSWREEPPSRRQVWLERTLCTPVLWLSFFRHWMRWKLEHNPVGWLEQRTWSGRLVTWGWIAVLISVYSTVLTDRHFFWVANAIQEVMACILAGSLAASAAGSFHRERESGVLELLLVSPLGEGQIISGRLRGLWSQFAPTAGLLLAVWAYCSSFLPNGSGAGVLFFYAVIFLTLPVFGLYFSLRCHSFLAAFLFTLATGLLLPLGMAELIGFLRWATVFTGLVFSLEMRASPPAAGCQLLLAACCWWRLQRRLEQRAFPLERAAG